jgi:hypothetical protein
VGLPGVEPGRVAYQAASVNRTIQSHFTSCATGESDPARRLVEPVPSPDDESRVGALGIGPRADVYKASCSDQPHAPVRGRRIERLARACGAHAPAR